MELNLYARFNDKKSSCYMRLWELKGGDGGEDMGLRFGGSATNDLMWDVDGMSDASLDTESAPDGSNRKPDIRPPVPRDKPPAPPREH